MGEGTSIGTLFKQCIGSLTLFTEYADGHIQLDSQHVDFRHHTDSFDVHPLDMHPLCFLFRVKVQLPLASLHIFPLCAPLQGLNFASISLCFRGSTHRPLAPACQCVSPFARSIVSEWVTMTFPLMS